MRALLSDLLKLVDSLSTLGAILAAIYHHFETLDQQAAIFWVLMAIWLGRGQEVRMLGRIIRGDEK